jgi:hypothetical protein
MSKRKKKETIIDEKNNNDIKIIDIPKITDGCVWICSIDPGKVNFAFIIEEVNLEQIKNIKNIPKKSRFNKDGASQEYNEILNKMYTSSKTILVECISIAKDASKEKYIDPKIFINLTDALDKYQKYFDQCSYIILEQQMSFGKRKNNTLCLKIAQHAFSYFTIFYRDFKTILDFPAYHKTKILGAPEKMDKPQRKKWAIEKAQEIWIDRNDFNTASKVQSAKKRDDLSDVLVQCMAFVYLKFIDKLL